MNIYTSLQLHKKLETFQQRAAIICTGAYKHTEHNALLTELGWNRLMDRAKHHKTTLFYKMSKGLCPPYLTNVIPPTAMDTSSITEKLSSHSLNGFSHYVKNYYISEYNIACSIDNCYICNRQ